MTTSPFLFQVTRQGGQLAVLTGTRIFSVPTGEEPVTGCRTIIVFWTAAGAYGHDPGGRDASADMCLLMCPRSASR